jgi:hypothetical protein
VEVIEEEVRMKKILLLLVLVFLGSNQSMAQNIKLSGQVTDSLGVPMEMANVIAFEKETNAMQGYSITDSNGNYKLSVPSDKSYVFRVSYIGFETLVEELTVSDEDVVKDLILTFEENSLDAVELSYEMPVTIKGDTIVYDADSFSDGTEKKLGDVLENLPGIDITENGEI